MVDFLLSIVGLASLGGAIFEFYKFVTDPNPGGGHTNGWIALVLAVAVPAFVVTTTGPLVAPAPTRAKSVVSVPTTISPAGTPPIETLTMPPSLMNPVPVIFTTVPGQEPAAVTTAGTAAFPPTQLEIVTAPADPAATRPSAPSSEKIGRASCRERVYDDV